MVVDGTASGYRLSVPLCLGAVLNPINSTMIATALTSIGADLDASTESVLWLVSLMYLASAVGQPVAGQLADRLGPRKVFSAGMVLVAVAGVVGTVAPNLVLLSAARFIVGLGTGAAYPAAIAMIDQQARRSGGAAPASTLGALMTVGLATLTVGPLLGGLLVETLGWRSIFAVNVPLALLPLALARLWLPRDEESSARPRVSADVTGVLLFSATLGALLLVSLNAAEVGWYAVLILLVAVAVLVSYEWRVPEPFLDVRMLLRLPALSLTYLRLALTFTIIYGVMFGFATWLTDSRGTSPASAGLLLLTLSGAGAVASAVTGRGGRVGRGSRVQLPLLVGTLSLAAASLMLLGVDSSTGLGYLAAMCVLFGIPNGLNLVANQVAVLRSAPLGQSGIASGFFRTSQYVGAMCATGAIGLSFGHAATDAGLSRLAASFVVIAAVLLVARVVDGVLTLRARR